MIKALLLPLVLVPMIPGSTIHYQAPQPVVVQATVTAYTSSVDETDEDPFVTASGERVREGIVACPSKYAFGTLVQIGESYYTCADRMNKRYRDTERFDIWVATKAEAWEWGKRELAILVHP